MSPAVLLRGLLRDLRDRPLHTLVTIWRYVREDPVVLLVRAVQGLPDGVALGLLGWSTRPWWAARANIAPVRWLRLLFLLRLGRTEQALTEAEAERPRGNRESVATARLLLDAEHPAAALTLCRRTNRMRPNGARVEALSLARLGHLAAARQAIESTALRWPRNTAVEKARRRIAGHQRSLDPSWAPPMGPPGRSIAAVPGRVLHILNNSLPHLSAGYTIRSQQVAEAQRAVGLDPHMVTRVDFPTDKGVLAVPSLEHVEGIPYHRLLPGRARELPPDEVATLQARLCEDLLREIQPAAIHATTPFFNAQVGRALATTYDLPFIYEVRGFLEETWASRFADREATELYEASRAVESACIRAADHVVTLGEAMRAEIIERGADPARVSVIGNAVDPHLFDPAAIDTEFRASLGFGANDVVVGYISSLVGYEGVDTLIEAVAQLREKSTRFRLLIVGDGVERLGLQRRAVELGLGNAAIFTGRVPHEAIRNHYGAIDLFVVPRRNVRVCRLVSPLKPIEAMALQRPLLVSDLPALTELLDGGANGRAFTAESASALAEQVLALADDPETCKALGRSARNWVLRHRTWPQNGKRYRSIYADLGMLC